jgi:hypothetical protein
MRIALHYERQRGYSYMGVAGLLIYLVFMAALVLRGVSSKYFPAEVKKAGATPVKSYLTGRPVESPRVFQNRQPEK